MPKREKGSETLECPTCGNELAASRQDDGALAAVTCSKCHPKTEAAAAKADERIRATEVPVDEQHAAEKAAAERGDA